MAQHLEGHGWTLAEQDEFALRFEHSGAVFYMPQPGTDGTYPADLISDLLAHRNIPHMP